jgi:hypothetical protein
VRQIDPVQRAAVDRYRAAELRTAAGKLLAHLGDRVGERGGR